mmetsp:Transcript_5644/g.8199  ORF Transcript_5644/g.8199 Transcript_5644/m.8199 type:complete len:138 (+) Transcript_5644:125-538(+)
MVMTNDNLISNSDSSLSIDKSNRKKISDADKDVLQYIVSNSDDDNNSISRTLSSLNIEKSNGKNISDVDEDVLEPIVPNRDNDSISRKRSSLSIEISNGKKINRWKKEACILAIVASSMTLTALMIFLLFDIYRNDS